MPKKFNGINQKAASASARKAAAEELKLEKLQKELEDQKWEDNDKHVLRKQKRKEEKEQKRQSALEKKAEKKVLLEKDAAGLKLKSPDTSKVTRAEIERNLHQQSLPDGSKNSSNVQRPKTLEPIEENVNRLGDEVDARSVTEAIAVLNLRQLLSDKNPTKRMKAGYKAFEKSRLETLRKENPSLRLNQVKQLLQKEWEKSPQNPLNKMQWNKDF